MYRYIRSRHFLILFILAVSGCFLAQAQEAGSYTDDNQKESTSAKKKKPADAAPAQQQGEEDPLKRQRPTSDKNAIKEKLEGPYKKWLNEDVRWIITDEELSAFKKLSNNTERDQFIEGFWLRRDPTPDTAENEYNEEHYRRIAYANEHYAAGIPGWKTDRGRIYVMYGPPTSIDSHPMAGTSSFSRLICALPSNACSRPVPKSSTSIWRALRRPTSTTGTVLHSWIR